MVYQDATVTTDQQGQYLVWVAAIVLFAFGMSLAYWAWPDGIAELTFFTLLRATAAVVIAVASFGAAVSVVR
jgi:hypothetical protein